MESYKNIMNKKSDQQLVQIIEFDFADYNQDALNCAKLELESRNLDLEILQKTRESIHKIIGDEVKKKEKIDTVIRQGNTGLSKFLDSINPATSKKDATILKLIASYLSIILLISIYQNWFYLHPKYIDIYSLEIFATILLLIGSVYGILTKDKIGWIILVGFLSYQFATHLVKLIDGFFMLINEFNSEPISTNQDDYEGIDLFIDRSFFQPNPAEIIGKAIGGLLISGGIIWFLSKQNIRRLFKVSEEQKTKAIVIGSLLGLIIWGSLIWI